MKYMKRYFDANETETVEIEKEQALERLTGYWKEEALKDIFENGKAFRLYTPYAEYWTVDDDGKVPMAGFYGIVG